MNAELPGLAFDNFMHKLFNQYIKYMPWFQLILSTFIILFKKKHFCSSVNLSTVSYILKKIRFKQIQWVPFKIKDSRTRFLQTPLFKSMWNASSQNSEIKYQCTAAPLCRRKATVQVQRTVQKVSEDLDTT